MKSLATFLCCLLISGALAQPAPPRRAFEVLVPQSFKVVGKAILFTRAAVVPHPPPPASFTITVAQPGMLQQTVDGAHWTGIGFCWSNAVVTNMAVPLMEFREQCGTFLAWSNSCSPLVTNYIVTEWTSHTGQGFQPFNVGNTNVVWLPFMDCGPCYFACAAQDSLGNISQFSNFCTNQAAGRPMISIASVKTP